MSTSLLAIGRLALDPDFRTRVAAATSMHGLTLTDHLIHTVIQADGVGDACTVVDISDAHPRGVDSSSIEDAAILAAVGNYTPPEETA